MIQMIASAEFVIHEPFRHEKRLSPPQERRQSLNDDEPGGSGKLLAQDALEIFQRSRQAFRQGVFGLPSGAPELVRTGAGMLHVAGAFRGMEHLGGGTRGLDDVLRQFFNGDLAAVPGIEHAGDFRMLRHEGEGPTMSFT